MTDIPLVFDTSDFAELEGILPTLKEKIGDIDENRRSLMEASPLYHVAEIETPVLIIYGSEDQRVDPDHSHRLMLMMDVFQKSYESSEVVGAAHSFTWLESQSVYPRLRRFLAKHLMPDRATETEGSGSP